MGTMRTWVAPWRYGLSIASIAVVTLVLRPLAPSLQQATIALLYLLVALICATAVGLGPAVLASLLAFLAFNFFFVPPLHTFHIANSQDLIHLMAFLTVAIVGSSLAARAQAQAETAARAASELAALYSLSQALSAEVRLDRILPVVATSTIRLLDVPSCQVLLYSEGGRLAEHTSQGQPPVPARTIDTVLRRGGRILGVLRIAQPLQASRALAEQQRRLELIAALVGPILERAQLVEEIGRALAEAEAARMKALLLSSVSHDLRTPLMVIKGAATNLLDESIAWSPTDHRDLLSAIDEEADRLNRVVGNLLDMSRIEGGALLPVRVQQSIEELIVSVAERMRPQLADRPVNIAIPGGLPLAPISYTQIDQVLTNLLENALKYSPAGTPIAIRAHATAQAITVEVCDQGPGIPPEMLGRVFEKFVRAVGPERHASGAGLGLAICKGIIEAHSGQIWAENPPQGGARFTFTLPLALAGEGGA